MVVHLLLPGVKDKAFNGHVGALVNLGEEGDDASADCLLDSVAEPVAHHRLELEPCLADVLEATSIDEGSLTGV